jgi:hypothetical protein
MESFTTNKKIGLACGIGLIISFFLPYVDAMGISMSLMDAAEMKADVWVFPLCGAAAAFLTFTDKVGMARIAFIVPLAFWVYGTFIDESAGGMDTFDFAGIGMYLLIASSVVGIVFSKE